MSSEETYVSFALRTIDFISKRLASNLLGKRIGNGRVSSIGMEDAVLEEWQASKESILQDFNMRNSSSDFSLMAFIPPQSNSSSTESQKRTMEDCSIVIKRKREIHTLPINIKCTMGLSYDNICGWNGLYHAIHGGEMEENENKKQNDFYSSGDITGDEWNDYLFMTFIKDGNGYLTGESYVDSLLSMKPGVSLKFNMSQSLPLQANHSIDNNFDEMTERVSNGTCLMKRRKELCEFLASSMKSSLNGKLRKVESFERSLNE